MALIHKLDNGSNIADLFTKIVDMDKRKISFQHIL